MSLFWWSAHKVVQPCTAFWCRAFGSVLFSNLEMIACGQEASGHVPLGSKCIRRLILSTSDLRCHKILCVPEELGGAGTCSELIVVLNCRNPEIVF